MRSFVFATATAAAAFGAVLATPSMAQSAPFEGGHVEAVGGYDLLKDGGNGSSEGTSGFAYGVNAGYDFRSGGMVFGPEAEITGATTDSRSYNAFTAGDVLSINAGRDLYIGGRVGAVISPQAMIYAKAGYTNARVNANYTAGTTTQSDHSDLDGFRLGAGMEYNLTPSTFVKGEYRYSHYNNIDGYNIDADRHQLMAGVGFRF